MKRATVAALAETMGALAVTAWVGGQAALGAFGARFVFGDLPRELAAPTMNHIFRAFDRLILVALVVVVASALIRLGALGLRNGADRVALAASVALVLLGLLDVAWVHPAIGALYDAGRTLDPSFHSLHALSARAAKLEIAVAALLFGAWAFARRPSS
jgi:hypothetical protein